MDHSEGKGTATWPQHHCCTVGWTLAHLYQDGPHSLLVALWPALLATVMLPPTLCQQVLMLWYTCGTMFTVALDLGRLPSWLPYSDFAAQNFAHSWIFLPKSFNFPNLL